MPFEISSTYAWLGLAIALALVEISTVSLVSIWFVIGSLFAFGTSFITDSLVVQMAVFIAVSGVALAFTRPLVKKHIHKNTVPTNADMLIGKTCTVIQPVTPQQKGRVMVDGQSWMAASTVSLKEGQQVVVEKISGVTLTVSPVETKMV